MCLRFVIFFVNDPILFSSIEKSHIIWKCLVIAQTEKTHANGKTWIEFEKDEEENTGT